LLVGAVFLAFDASSAAVVPKPLAGRCAYGLGVILRPPGLVNVFMERIDAGSHLQQSTQLATVGRVGGTLSPACDRVKALRPARIRGLAGPWSLRTESKIYCPGGGTLQIRPILSKRHVIGTRVLLLRKDTFEDIQIPSVHALDGRHVIVDVSLRASRGGLWFDPTYCDRNTIP